MMAMGNSKGIVKILMIHQSTQQSISMRYEFNDYRKQKEVSRVHSCGNGRLHSNMDEDIV